MRKIKVSLGWVFPVCVLFVALAISLLAHGKIYSLSYNSPAFLTTSSPKGTYTVSLTGQKNRPRVPLTTHEVRFSVAKGERPFLSNKYLHSGDWLDPSFDILYPQQAWLDDNILHFYRQEYFDKGQPETIVVVNDANKIIDYLKVTSGDLYMLFNIQPKSTRSLTVSPPRGDSRWINIEGEFPEGQSIKKKGVGFNLSKELIGPFTYCIHITENNSTIHSPHLD